MYTFKTINFNPLPGRGWKRLERLFINDGLVKNLIEIVKDI